MNQLRSSLFPRKWRCFALKYEVFAISEAWQGVFSIMRKRICATSRLGCLLVRIVVLYFWSQFKRFFVEVIDSYCFHLIKNVFHALICIKTAFTMTERLKWAVLVLRWKVLLNDIRWLCVDHPIFFTVGFCLHMVLLDCYRLSLAEHCRVLFNWFGRLMESVDLVFDVFDISCGELANFQRNERLWAWWVSLRA